MNEDYSTKMQSRLLILLVCLGSFVYTKAQDATPAPNNNATKDVFSTEIKLVNDLLENYSKAVRPVANPSQTLPVTFSFILLSMDELDEKTQYLSLQGWVKMSWTDKQLAWDPANYDNLAQTRIPMKKLWIPDITLFDHSLPMFDSELELPLVYSNGLVFWIPKVNIKARCYVDMYKFPNDKHLCSLKFGSWTHHEKELNITIADPTESLTEPDFYKEHLEWEIKESDVKRNAKKYPCCEELYIDITYQFTVSRRSAYHTHMFVAPSVVMALLIPFVFFLPAESHEKTIFGLGLLIGNVIMLGQMESFIQGAHPIVPQIGIYYLVNIVLIGLSLGFSALITNIWHRSPNRRGMPGCLRGIVGILSKLFCVNRDDYMMLATGENHNSRHLESISGENNTDQANYDDMNRFMKTTAREAAAAEWRQLAIVLDRLLFVVFLAIAIITTICIV